MVRYNERALVLGSTGSGKSEVLNVLSAGLRCQRLVLDTKDEFAVPGIEPVRDVDAIDWSQRTVHYQTAPDAGPDEFDDVFRACYYRPGALTVIVHELGDICEFNANRTPRWFNAYISKGRARGKGLYMGSQRPQSIPTRALGESEHVFMVGERFLVPQDHAKVADAMGQDPRELARTIDHVQAELGEPADPQGRTHAFLWFQRGRRQVVACPPLPPAHRQAIDIARTLEGHAPQSGAADADEDLIT